MAKYVQEGKTIDFTNSTEADIAYGDVVVITSRIGIAGENIPAGATGSLHLTGVWELPLAASQTLSVGTEVYWDAANQVITTTDTGNTKAGIVAYLPGSQATMVLVRI